MQMASSANLTFQGVAVGFAINRHQILMPSSLQAQMTLKAISPRFAIRIFLNMQGYLLFTDADGEERLAIFHGLVV